MTEPDYKRMFHEALGVIGDITNELGISYAESMALNGPEGILARIRALREQAQAKTPHAPDNRKLCTCGSIQACGIVKGYGRLGDRWKCMAGLANLPMTDREEGIF